MRVVILDPYNKDDPSTWDNESTIAVILDDGKEVWRCCIIDNAEAERAFFEKALLAIVDEATEASRRKIDEWRDASGLIVGGDPGGVEPRHLRRWLSTWRDVLNNV